MVEIINGKENMYSVLESSAVGADTSGGEKQLSPEQE